LKCPLRGSTPGLEVIPSSGPPLRRHPKKKSFLFVSAMIPSKSLAYCSTCLQRISSPLCTPTVMDSITSRGLLQAEKSLHFTRACTTISDCGYTVEMRVRAAIAKRAFNYRDTCSVSTLQSVDDSAARFASHLIGALWRFTPAALYVIHG
ncbi:hypothetical protein M8C21_004873, partial [Ambrosia artemisiifolia]